MRTNFSGNLSALEYRNSNTMKQKRKRRMPKHACCSECGSTELEVLHITKTVCKDCGRSKLRTCRKDQSKR